jgi:AraC family transcriptional regulator, regulatory protein of adaptative response / DNA-3-methyladenine glycosylase II
VLRVRLAHRLPFPADARLGFLATRAVAGVEIGSGPHFARTLSLPHGTATVELVPEPRWVRATLRLDDLRDLTPAVQRCRRLFDLDADPVAVANHLGSDPVLGSLVRAQPGLRMPGCVDPHEMALRIVVGQQVSVPGARRILGRLVAEYGKPLAAPLAVPGGELSHLFPAPATLAGVDPATLPLPRARAAALVTLAGALASGEVVLEVGSDAESARWSLRGLPGIGPWTADCVAVRALGHPDVLLSGDLGVRRACAVLGLGSTPAAVDAAAEPWRPWRSYAMAYLWDAAAPRTRRPQAGGLASERAAP